MHFAITARRGGRGASARISKRVARAAYRIGARGPKRRVRGGRVANDAVLGVGGPYPKEPAPGPVAVLEQMSARAVLA